MLYIFIWQEAKKNLSHINVTSRYESHIFTIINRSRRGELYGEIAIRWHRTSCGTIIRGQPQTCQRSVSRCQMDKKRRRDETTRFAFARENPFLTVTKVKDSTPKKTPPVSRASLVNFALTSHLDLLYHHKNYRLLLRMERSAITDRCASCVLIKTGRKLIF